jgi:hypothetical protein
MKKVWAKKEKKAFVSLIAKNEAEYNTVRKVESVNLKTNDFESKLNYSLQQETGRTGTTEFLKSL